MKWLDRYDETKDGSDRNNAIPTPSSGPTPMPIAAGTMTAPQPDATAEPPPAVSAGAVEFGYTGERKKHLVGGDANEETKTLNLNGAESSREYLFSGVSTGGTVELRMIDATGRVVPAAIEMKPTPVPGPGQSQAGMRGRDRASVLGRHAPTTDNPFEDPMQKALSTFSVDVDTASYTETRRLILKDGRLPHRDQVRIEEFLKLLRISQLPGTENERRGSR